MSRRTNRWLGAVALDGGRGRRGCSSDGYDATTDETAGAAATTEAVTAPTDTEPDDTTAVTTADTAADTTPDTSEAEAVEAPTGEPIKFMAATAVGGVVAQPEIFDAVDAAVDRDQRRWWNSRSCRRPQPPTRGHALRSRRRRQRRPRCRLALRPGFDRRGRDRRGRQVPLRCRRHPGVGPGRHPDDRHSPSRDRGLPQRTRLSVEWRAHQPAGPGSASRCKQAGAKTIALVTGDVEAGRQLPGTHRSRASPRRGRPRPGGVRPARSVGRLHAAAEPAGQCQSRRDRRVRFERHQRSRDLRAPQRRLHRPDRCSWNRARRPKGSRPSATPPRASSWSADSRQRPATATRSNSSTQRWMPQAPDAARTELAIDAWASVHLFADVLSELDTIDSRIRDRRARQSPRRPRRRTAVHARRRRQPARASSSVPGDVPGAGDPATVRSCHPAMARSSTSTTSSPAECPERTTSFRPARSGRRCGLRADRAGARADLSRLGRRELRPRCVRDDRAFLYYRATGDRNWSPALAWLVALGVPALLGVLTHVLVMSRLRYARRSCESSRPWPCSSSPSPSPTRCGGSRAPPCARRCRSAPREFLGAGNGIPEDRLWLIAIAVDRHRGAVGAVPMDPLRSLHRRRR